MAVEAVALTMIRYLIDRPACLLLCFALTACQSPGKTVTKPEQVHLFKSRDVALTCQIPPKHIYNKRTFDQRGKSIVAYWKTQVRSEQFAKLFMPRGYRYFDETLFKLWRRPELKCPMTLYWFHLVEPKLSETQDRYITRPPTIKTKRTKHVPVLSADHIRAVIGASTKKLLTCYNALLRTDPNAKGEVRVRFIVNKEGEVILPILYKSSTQSRALEQCTLSYVQSLQFDKPGHGAVTIISYPFNFTVGKITDTNPPDLL